MMPILSIRRGKHKLLHAAAFGVCRLELPRHCRWKPVVVFGIDPEHGHGPMFASSLSKCPKGIDHAAQVAVVLVSVPAPATCEADGGLQLLWWISHQCCLRESAGRYARAHYRLSIHLGQILSKLHYRLQILRACLARLLKGAMLSAASAIVAVPLAARLAVALPHHHDRHISTPRKPQGLPKLRPRSHVLAFLLHIRRAVRQHRQRMPSRPVDV